MDTHPEDASAKRNGADGPDARDGDSKQYALCFRVPGRQSVWRIRDQGIALSDQHISWSLDGGEMSYSLKDVAEVHLQTGAIGEEVIASCRLTFADGTVLSIASCDSGGVHTSPAQAELYSDFVHELHARLARLEGASTVFTAGYGEARYRVVQVLFWIAVVFFGVAPTLAVLVSGEWGKLPLVLGGFALTWMLRKLMSANAPRSYDPRHLPEELIPAQPRSQGLASWIAD